MSARSMRARLALVLALALVAPGLTACGKKPQHLDPPEGSGPEASKFPHAYPADKYDPSPAPAHGAKPAPVLEPIQPSSSAYPPIIRPENLTPNSAVGGPEGTGSGSAQPWPSLLKSQ